MHRLKINICSIEDPRDPKTWSGTPYNLYRQLSKNGNLADAFRTLPNINKIIRRIINSLLFIYYGTRFQLYRTLFWRNFAANRAKSITNKSLSDVTLHMGTMDLPFGKPPLDQKHYLYCDSTWHLKLTDGVTPNRCSKRLIKAAERLDRKSYEQVIHIFSVSEHVKKDLIIHYGICEEKITVVGTGLGVIKPYFGYKDYANGKILFVAKGRFEDKGGELVLEAFEIALKTNPNLELSIVGQSSYEILNSRPGVKTYGFIPLEELQDLFNTHSLFLMPGLYEPWGLVYLEAMACRMPIVGLNRNSFPELSKDGKYGFGLDENDPKRLAEIIVNAFKTPEKLNKMGLSAQDYCLAEYSWSGTVKKVIQVIDQIENRRSNSSQERYRKEEKP